MKKNIKNRYSVSSKLSTDEEYSDVQMSSLAGDRVPRGIECEENRVYFYCPVFEQEALELNRLLRRLDVEMKYLTNRLDSPDIPIHLHIHSPGGSIFAGLSIVDTINSCSTKIHTHVDGSAASAATLISASGAPGNRTMGKNAFMLVHQPRLEWAGKLDEFIDEIQNQEVMYEKVKQVYLENCGMKEKKLDKLLQHELWLPAKDCIKLGLVDKIL